MTNEMLKPLSHMVKISEIHDSVGNFLLYFLRAGKLSYAIPLNMSRYLYKEFEYVPWRTALSGLTYIGSRLLMTPYYGLYQVSS